MSLICHAKKLLSQVPKIQQCASISTTANCTSCGNGKCPMIRIVGCGPRLGYECKKKKKRCRCVKVDAPYPSFSECLRCPPPPPRMTECPNCSFVAFSPRLNPPKHCVKPNYGTSIDGCNPPDSMRMLGSCRPRNMGCKKVNETCDYVDPSILVCDPCIKPFRNECCTPCQPAPASEAPPCYDPKPSCGKPVCNAPKPNCRGARPICVTPKPTCTPQQECPEPVVYHYPKPSKIPHKPMCEEPKPASCEAKPQCEQESICSAPEMKSSVFVKLKPKPACGLPPASCDEPPPAYSQPPPVCPEPQPVCPKPPPVCDKPFPEPVQEPPCVKATPKPACEKPPSVGQKAAPVCEAPKPVCEAPKPVCAAPMPACETKPVCEPKVECCTPPPPCEEPKPSCRVVKEPEPSPCQTKDRPICCSKAVCSPNATPCEMEAALRTCRPCEDEPERAPEILYSKPVSCSNPRRVSGRKSVSTLLDSFLDLVNLRRK